MIMDTDRRNVLRAAVGMLAAILPLNIIKRKQKSDESDRFTRILLGLPDMSKIVTRNNLGYTHVNERLLESYLRTKISGIKTDKKIYADIYQKIKDDYQNSNVISSNGWLISKTEYNLSKIRFKYV